MNNENFTETPERGGQKLQKWFGLSGGAVKVIGLVLMVMDHLHQMFINQGAPSWLSWFGRPVAAMFLFLCAEGFYYTRSKKIYILRLLGAFILMNLVSGALTKLWYVENAALINNIFGTLFVSAFYMLMVDLFREGIREKRPGRILLAIGGFLLPAATGLAFAVLLSGNGPPGRIFLLLFYLIPSLLTVEGGFMLVFMGTAFYILRKYRWAQALTVIAVGIIVLFTVRDPGGEPDPQWLMVFAVLPLLLYNGRRGWGGKYFFYIFYPAHIYLFYLIAWFLQR